MDKTPTGDESSKPSVWQRRRKLLLGCAGAFILCGVALGLIAILPPPLVTSAREQAARQGLNNPASASLRVGHYGDASGWFSVQQNDYAEQDGMVIFPNPKSLPEIIDNTSTVLTHPSVGLDAERICPLSSMPLLAASSRPGPTRLRP